MSIKNAPLKFEVLSVCGFSRTGRVTTSHGSYGTPVFMPVGTQGTIKGIFPEQLKSLDCRILLGNTYHLELHPGSEIMRKMVSLVKLSATTEEGVEFSSPRDGTLMMLTPEKSINIQESIGSDIAMQLDDVIKTTTEGQRVVEAMERSGRWLNRCLQTHSRKDQCIFAIIQGGLDVKLREKCVSNMTGHDLCGYAIGGLSGGEEKSKFSQIVRFTSSVLPFDKPRYCMGVGYMDDILICIYHGVDMFDCVYPTRTARFGSALTPKGTINLRHREYEDDFTPIDVNCDCFTCSNYSKSYLHMIATKTPSSCQLITIHNLRFYMQFLAGVRECIDQGRFNEFLHDYFHSKYPGSIPGWIREALAGVI